MKLDLNNLSDLDLIELLCTVDGCGKERKKEVLKELSERYRKYGYDDGWEIGYAQGKEDGQRSEVF